ncbi:DUF86 domain-containing protein [Desulfobulbus sp. F5]|nr:DUF86 domain-containing protein [Desulfobulbus sp. F5]
MSVRRASLFLADILEAINAVERFTAGMNFEQFHHDEKTIRAVERELEIIGEASRTHCQSASICSLAGNRWHERPPDSSLLGHGSRNSLEYH